MRLGPELERPAFIRHARDLGLAISTINRPPGKAASSEEQEPDQGRNTQHD